MQNNKKITIGGPRHGLLAVIVFGVGILGSILIVFGHAQTGYSNPYSCPSHPTLSTNTGSSQPTCTKYVQYVLGITVDGSYGPNTKTAVQHFQFNTRVSNSGCSGSYTSCDGVVGSSTWSKIDSSNSAQTQASQQSPTPNPSGSMNCAGSTASSVTLNISYSNASGSKPVYLYRSKTVLATYTNGSASLSYVDNGLAEDTTYVYQLRNSSTALVSINCSTSAAPAPPPTSPAPKPSSGGSTSAPPPSTAPTAAQPSAPAQTTTTKPKAPSGGSSGSGGLSVQSPAPLTLTNGDSSDGGTTSTPSTPSTSSGDQPSGNEYTDTTDYSTPSDSVNTKPKTKLKAKRKSSAWKTVGVTFGVIALLAVAAGIIYIFRPRKSSGSYGSVSKYTAPQAPQAPAPTLAPHTAQTPAKQAQPVSQAFIQQLPASPPAKAAPPFAKNVLDKIINDTFYPGQSKPLETKKVKDDQPKDMFEEAREHPESFGNTHYSSESPLPTHDEPTPKLK